MTETPIQSPHWSAAYPQYYKMLRHEFASDNIRFQKDVIDPINATFEFISRLEIDAQEKEKTKELCIANAAFSARAANGVYFSRQRKENENWGHERWRQREKEWQYAVFYVALLINLYSQSVSENDTNIHHLSFILKDNDDEIGFAIRTAILDRDHESMPHQFYPLIKRMRVKTSRGFKK